MARQTDMEGVAQSFRSESDFMPLQHQHAFLFNLVYGLLSVIFDIAQPIHKVHAHAHGKGISLWRVIQKQVVLGSLPSLATITIVLMRRLVRTN